MIRHVVFFSSLVMLAIIFTVVTLLNNVFFADVQVDLTENQVYSLSDGSLGVINNLDAPVDLFYFFSDGTTKGMTALRTYAERVERLLDTYAAQSKGKIRLHKIDPEPFSENEDRAAEFGLTAAQLGAVGDAVYFGLAGTNLLDDLHIIGFFDPQQERFLEYEISKLIHQLAQPDPPHVGIVSGLPMSATPNPMTGQLTPAMTLYTQLQQLYEVTLITPDQQTLPESIDLLVVVHPYGLAESLNQAIERHVFDNGKLIALIDPLFESASVGPAQSSDNSLLGKWGITVDTDNVLLDAALAVDVRGQQGLVVSHPGILGLVRDNLDSNDIVTANLDAVNMSSAGSISIDDNSGLSFQPLILSSSRAEKIPVDVLTEQPSPEALARLLTGNGQQYPIAARISGSLKAHYQANRRASVKLLVFADADMLVDRFWVQQNQFFGQTITTPFADNGDLLINSIDNFSGSSELISVRSRGTYSRPFERVSELEVAAETKYRAQEERLQKELEDVETQLNAIQVSGGEDELFISPEQELAANRFMDKKLEIRKALREVRLQLERDIAALGNRLKIINILVFPLGLTLLIWALAKLLRRRAPQLN